MAQVRVTGGGEGRGDVVHMFRIAAGPIGTRGVDPIGPRHARLRPSVGQLTPVIPVNTGKSSGSAHALVDEAGSHRATRRIPPSAGKGRAASRERVQEGHSRSPIGNRDEVAIRLRLFCEPRCDAPLLSDVRIGTVSPKAGGVHKRCRPDRIYGGTGVEAAQCAALFGSTLAVRRTGDDLASSGRRHLGSGRRHARIRVESVRFSCDTRHDVQVFWPRF